MVVCFSLSFHPVLLFLLLFSILPLSLCSSLKFSILILPIVFCLCANFALQHHLCLLSSHIAFIYRSQTNFSTRAFSFFYRLTLHYSPLTSMHVKHLHNFLSLLVSKMLKYFKESENCDNTISSGMLESISCLTSYLEYQRKIYKYLS